MTEGAVFVFGSNLAGRHGKGEALRARREWGAVCGKAEGRWGFSYGIPTKDENLHPLPLSEIQGYVKRFIEYAQAHPSTVFLVTRVGCGYARYKDEQIAPFFRDAPINCQLPDNWRWLAEQKK